MIRRVCIPVVWTALGATLQVPLIAQQQAAQQQSAAPSLQILPREVRVDDASDRPRITVLATDATGVQRDVTKMAQWDTRRDESDGTPAPPPTEPLATVDAGVVLGLAAGHGRLSARWNGAEASVPLVVAGIEPRTATSFANDVVPHLTRQGCNSGACHGAASGKNGFRLSLFGYDPTLDHRSLTRELRGRRADPSRPEHSLVLTKPSGGVAHKGGTRFDEDSEAYRVLRRWIEAGVTNDSGDAADVTRLAIHPQTAVLAAGADPMGLIVVAHYSDGTDRDVTDLALLSTSNEGSVALGDGTDGSRIELTPGRRGEAAIMARFGPFAEVAQVLVVPTDVTLAWPEDAVAQNYVDEFVHRKLRRMRVAPARRCSDEVFIRRVTVDLLQRLPTPEETLAFLADEHADKRSRWIDRLLDDPAFADVQAMRWAETLQVRRQTHGDKGVTLFRRFLRDGFRQGRPFDAMVRELLTATGDTHTVPAANFYVGTGGANLTGEKVAQSFLGIRIQCAQCHDHPFDNWTMDDYYGFAAYFAQIGRKVGDDGYQWTVWNQRYGDVRHERSREIVVPTVLGGSPEKVPSGTDRREVLANWVTAADNPWFARNVVLRVWEQLLGAGLVAPADDVRVSNPASHPALVAALAKRFVEAGFDVRAVVRDICSSRTYQLGPHEDQPDARWFAGNQVRRLSAEAMLDGIASVTGVANRLRGLDDGARATQLEGEVTDSRFLAVFGRPDRQSACTCERSDEPTLGQALHLLNGDTIQEKLGDGDNRVARALRDGRPPTEVLDELFLAAYSRRPRSDERERILEIVAAAGEDPMPAWQDVLWAILNSKEFVFHH